MITQGFLGVYLHHGYVAFTGTYQTWKHNPLMLQGKLSNNHMPCWFCRWCRFTGHEIYQCLFTLLAKKCLVIVRQLEAYNVMCCNVVYYLHCLHWLTFRVNVRKSVLYFTEIVSYTNMNLCEVLSNTYLNSRSIILICFLWYELY